jgi:CBS domain containing-hemolysin-like protein
MSDWAGIVWLVVLLAFNAFFVGAEFAVISARRSQIEPKADAGSKSAKTALYAMENASLMLATSQLGITVCSLLILGVSEPAIHHLLQGPLSATGLSPQLVDVIAFVIALLLVSYLHVVLGEMVPKNASFSVPDRAVLILAPPLVFVAKVFGPLIRFLNMVSNGLLRLFGVRAQDEVNSTFTLEEVANIVSHSTREGVLEDRSGALVAAFEFTEKKVNDVAISIDELVMLPLTATPADVEAAVTKYGFSRFVLTADDGEIAGYVHAKDIIDLRDDEMDAQIPVKRVRAVISVLEETDLEDALARLRSTGGHIARVLTPEGVTTGVLFFEDIVEELVGEVNDATRRGRFE